MSRRRAAVKREVLPDAKFGDQVLTKFINCLMYEGKKSAAESIVYGAFDRISKRGGQDPLRIFHDALANVRPAVEVRSRRVGGRHVPGASRGPHRSQPSAGDPLADRHGTRSFRKYHGGTPVGRIDGCRAKSRRRGQEAGGHAPHGGCEQSLLALPLVIDATAGS